MEIPLNAKVKCTDGVSGRSEFVLVNPVVDQVTYLVVEDDVSPNTEYMVPVDFVIETIADTIRLNCSKAEMENMEPFIKTTVIDGNALEKKYDHRGGMYGIGSTISHLLLLEY